MTNTAWITRLLDCLAGRGDEVLAYAKQFHTGLSSDDALTYQKGKVAEEIGELIQAMSARNYANGRSYPDVRGSVESEAADVIIAAYVLVSLKYTEAPLVIPVSVEYLGASERADLLVSALRRDDIDLVISIAASILAHLRCDPASAVADRVDFNKTR